MHELKPLKRHVSLQPLSRDHHQGLLLCWKIRSGLSNGVAPDKIKSYVSVFFEEHLAPHFELEEQHVFPLLGDESHPMVKRALREHRKLKKLLTITDDLERRLHQFEELLSAHIRFEERVMFAELQSISTPEQLLEIEQRHHANLQ